MPDAVLSGWWVGLGIAFAVIVVVVVLVSSILTLARRIGIQAAQIVGDLDRARMNSLGLWDVEKTNAHLRSIVESAQQARTALGG